MLQNLTVLEFAEGIAGPLAGVRLQDLGASVLKIERAEGDWLRGAAPVISGTDISAAFFELNRGKRSLRLGARPELAASLLRRLVEKADVFIVDRSDAELESLGLLDTVRNGCPENPGLIIADISPWGRKGPMAGQKGSELTAQAMAGYNRYLGARGQPARRLGADVASIGTGVFTLQAVMAALYWRRKTGKGQRVSTSLLNSLLSMKSIQIAAQSDPDVYAGPRVGGPNDPPEQGWKTADRPIFFSFGGSVGAEGRPGWEAFIEEMGMHRLLSDPRFSKVGKNSTGHGIDSHKLRYEYEKDFVKVPSAKLVEMIHKHRANAAAYVSVDETLSHPQTKALDIIRSVPLDGERDTRIRAFPVRFSRTRPKPKGTAPRLGEHGEAILLENGFTRTDFERLCAERALAP